jgi:hypothetical protein
MGDETADAMPICPKCGQAMRLDRITPKFAALPELRTYACRPCGEAVTEEQGGE